MIKNIVFDIGGVITRFDPNDYLSPFGFDKDKSKALNEAIFKGVAWKDYMVGKIDKNQYKKMVVEENLHLKDYIEYILDDKNTSKLLPPLKEGVEFCKAMKKKGYNIYILSNIVGASLEYFKNSFEEVTECLSGAVYSCEVGLKKPDEQVFKLLLDRYNLVPSQTLFLDDSFKNVKKARELNINGELCQPLLNKNAFQEIAQKYNLINENEIDL